MKIAIAQIDMPFADIQATCGRLAQQALLASVRDADLMCVPASLFCSPTPSGLLANRNYQHDLLRALEDLASSCERASISMLVPATAVYQDVPYLEFFLLQQGFVTPLRLTLNKQGSRLRPDAMGAVSFRCCGERVCSCFDVDSRLASLPKGADVLVCFQLAAFSLDDESTAGLPALSDGFFSDQVAAAGVWFTYVAPVGGFEHAAYTGGSFILDDAGSLVAHAASFEEALLVHDVERGTRVVHRSEGPVPSYHRETWLWGALRLFLRDWVHGSGFERVVIELDGSLESALLASLAVDALGSRQVIGLALGRSDMVSPREEHDELNRCRLIRDVARRLHIQLLEHELGDFRGVFDGDTRLAPASLLRRILSGAALAEVERTCHAVALCPATKTEYALAPDAMARAYCGRIAPFCDVSLSLLELLARHRNRVSSVIPEELLRYEALQSRCNEFMTRAVAAVGVQRDQGDQMVRELQTLKAREVDEVLADAVERGLSLDDIALAHAHPKAVALLLMVLQHGESARQLLPDGPWVTACALKERFWPQQVTWCDMGRDGSEALDVDRVADEAVRRVQPQDDAHGEQARREVWDTICGLLGLTSEQRDQLRKAMAGEDAEEGDHDDAAPNGPSRRVGFLGMPSMPGSPTNGDSPFSIN